MSRYSNGQALKILQTVSGIILAFSLAPSLATGLADPTKPALIKKAVSKPSPGKRAQKKGNRWHLTSILIASDRRTAIIDKQLLTVGDRLHGARVLAIEADRVVLRRRGKTIRLILKDKDIKRHTRQQARTKKARRYE